MNKIILFSLLICGYAFAQMKTFGLQDSDQKFYKNDQMEGNNQYERIDMNVKEINKLHGEINVLKEQVKALQADVEKLKASK